ncbi:unnamed protein product [Ilex paraguariensis]|uniref:Uncharacterized protein n=1 Tax=Ilex paraguariensis TaxID=185542 RepID=A0ABC8RMT1_9AQUA
MERGGMVTIDSCKLMKAASNSQQEPLTIPTTTKGHIKANLERGSSGPSCSMDCGTVGGAYRTPWNQILSPDSAGISSNPAKQMKFRYIEPIKRDSKIIV